MTTEERISIEDEINITHERQKRFNAQLARLETAWGIGPSKTQDTDNLDDHAG